MIRCHDGDRAENHTLRLRTPGSCKLHSKSLGYRLQVLFLRNHSAASGLFALTHTSPAECLASPLSAGSGAPKGHFGGLLYPESLAFLVDLRRTFETSRIPCRTPTKPGARKARLHGNMHLQYVTEHAPAKHVHTGIAVKHLAKTGNNYAIDISSKNHQSSLTQPVQVTGRLPIKTLYARTNPLNSCISGGRRLFGGGQNI